MSSPPNTAPTSLGRRVDRTLSKLVDQAIPRSEALNGLLAVTVAFFIAVHVWGLLSVARGLGEHQLDLETARALDLDEQVMNYGEIQPIGVLQEALTFLVVVLLVGVLTASVRRWREGGGADTLPRSAARVALVALVRPRRVADELWRRSGPPEGRPPGGVLLDLLWPTWILAAAAMGFADHLADDAATLSEARPIMWIHVGAEVLFVVTGAVLLWVTVALERRLRTGRGASRGSVLAFGAVCVTGLLALGGASAIAYVTGTRYAPSAEDAAVQFTIRDAWEGHENAAASGDAAALRRTATGAMLAEDLAGLRAQERAGRRVRFARQLEAVTPFPAGSRATRMLGVVATQGSASWTQADPSFGWSYVALARARPGAPWKVLLDVPVLEWPWGDTAPPVAGDPRAGGRLATAALREATGAGRVESVVGVTLASGRTLSCGAADDRPVCVLADPGARPTVVGDAG